jgi:hypothetical protein
MDGGIVAYYWTAAVLTLALHLIIEEYKKNK